MCSVLSVVLNRVFLLRAVVSKACEGAVKKSRQKPALVQRKAEITSWQRLLQEQQEQEQQRQEQRLRPVLLRQQPVPEQ